MSNTSWTQQHLDDLEAAIAEGALEVRYQDRTVVYRSLNDMLKTRDLIRQALGHVDRKGTRILTKFDKGL